MTSTRARKVETLTHKEILAYALRSIIEEFEIERKLFEKERHFNALRPDEKFDKALSKVVLALQMYKMETGYDYGYEIDEES